MAMGFMIISFLRGTFLDEQTASQIQYESQDDAESSQEKDLNFKLLIQPDTNRKRNQPCGAGCQIEWFFKVFCIIALQSQFGQNQNVNEDEIDTELSIVITFLGWNKAF